MLDSNIIIYAASPAHVTLREMVEREAPSASLISKVESQGFHRLSDRETLSLEKVLANIEMLPIDVDVIERAISLRRQKKMSLGDSIVAATALVHDLTLVTRNVGDFTWIPELRLLNPFDPPASPSLTPAPG